MTQPHPRPQPQRISLSSDQVHINVMKNVGLTSVTKLSGSLQGGVWKAVLQLDSDPAADEINSKSMSVVIVKTANKVLAQKKLALVSQKLYQVREDIVLEAMILKYLTVHQLDCPASIIKFYRLLDTKRDYYLMVEYGGHSLFTFVCNAHKAIDAGKLPLHKWKQLTKKIFIQMVACLDYIHSRKVCHFDVSLENFVVNHDGENLADEDDTALNNIQIKLIDFGLAQLFISDSFSTTKWCGKVRYQSPECYEKKNAFDAKANDLWCLGVTFFTFAFGTPPFKRADKNDALFMYMTNEEMMVKVLRRWNKLQYADQELVRLLCGFFKDENTRITLSDLKSDAWLK
eukprot:CAMPEP_0202693398 /NCGR_PEP_ID=MMETSP1385-20130828/7525_1 /ASSEMBLY_ACC=CAM_ASM_000861 /TAXON_ID=933848 /ORGANISM="Elphidium margaritaceum" /LENGTH=343 /DNA_ID=CAMNT_0049349075 /DNA_START=34 /DNA_END=1065 /DNA_ORIENTATION=-